jgi:hypothetical protein
MENYFIDNNIQTSYENNRQLAEFVGALKLANSVRALLMEEMRKREHKDEFLNNLFNYLNV